MESFLARVTCSPDPGAQAGRALFADLISEEQPPLSGPLPCFRACWAHPICQGQAMHHMQDGTLAERPKAKSLHPQDINRVWGLGGGGDSLMLQGLSQSLTPRG